MWGGRISADDDHGDSRLTPTAAGLSALLGIALNFLHDMLKDSHSRHRLLAIVQLIGILTAPPQVHVINVHTPDQQQYTREGRGINHRFIVSQCCSP